MAGQSIVLFSPRKLAEFAAKLATPAPRGECSNSNSDMDAHGEDGVAEKQGEAFPIEVGTKHGDGTVREGEIPHRGSRATKISRVIPVVMSTTFPPGGGDELESFKEEEGMSCTDA